MYPIMPGSTSYLTYGAGSLSCEGVTLWKPSFFTSGSAISGSLRL